MSAAPQRRTCHFTGRVQGVGFRYTTESIARNYAVKGHVRNLRDGRVELVVEGEPSEIDNLLAALRARMGRHIQRVDSQTEPPTGEFTDFRIRH